LHFIFLVAYGDRDQVEGASSGKLTIGTGDQDDAITLASASNMTATKLDVSEIAVTRHRCQTVVGSSHTLSILLAAVLGICHTVELL